MSRLLANLNCKVAYPRKLVQQSSSCKHLFGSKSSKTMKPVEPLSSYTGRHIGPQIAEHEHMLKTVGVSSVDELINQVIPRHIRLEETQTQFELPAPCSEFDALQELKSKMDMNQLYRTYIGMGYYNTHTPSVILRNIIENPSWYTPYTPYQAEIAQGRLEMLLNFQTMVGSLVAKPLCNSSLLDESTACAEAMTMCLNIVNLKSDITPVFLVAQNCHPQNISVVQTRAEALGITIELIADEQIELRLREQESSNKSQIFGVLVQYPDTHGSVSDLRQMCTTAHGQKCLVVASTDLMACSLITPPGEWGADIVVGSAQRFGVPLGYGGPHAAFLATAEKYVRKMPGRIIGVTTDSRGKGAYRMALQTREQHIRRDKATSNLCTAQALLANVSAAYGIYHGPAGIQQIANDIHQRTRTLVTGLEQLSTVMKFEILNSDSFFDTITIQTSDSDLKQCLLTEANSLGMNFRSYFMNDANDCLIGLSLDETTEFSDICDILTVFTNVLNDDSYTDIVNNCISDQSQSGLQFNCPRKSQFMQHEIFSNYHSETAMMRYLYSLERKDLGLNTAMIPLGSCTMKLNAASSMIPLSWTTVAQLHPFSPVEQCQGYSSLITDMENWLAEVTGFDSVSLQPNSGAQGEYTGLLCIREYHKQRGEHLQRNICLIPDSAHGTNPASAAMAGWKIVPVNCDAQGNVDVDHLKLLAEKHSQQLAAAMITYPSTHGVFEDAIQEIIEVVHEHGGLVYMDGANLQAQLGYTTPGLIGADVCHLNLHKTFCIPHGGGGPGLGPIAVTKQLAPFLPSHNVIPCGKDEQLAIGAISAAPFSSASILVIPWMYIRMMGANGLKLATQSAILNANYMASRLDEHWPILYRRQGRCAHEFIIDVRKLNSEHKIGAEDVAKRLMDYSFHAPTMSWPVTNTLMIEPTESEPLAELDRLCDALISIRGEIADVEQNKIALEDSPLKGAPHTIDTLLDDEWNRAYSRTTAAVNPSKSYWPSVGRVDNVSGDKNLQCECPPMSYWTET